MLRIGVDIKEPNTPPLVMVKVPPLISSRESLPSRPLAARSLSVFSISAKDFLSQSRITGRSEEHTSELQSLMRISYAVFCLKKKKPQQTTYKTAVSL